MDYYIGVLSQREPGTWRAVFPDVPDCYVEASRLDSLVARAEIALACYFTGMSGRALAVLPRPRDLTAIKADKQWEAAHAITWSTAVITMIPVNV